MTEARILTGDRPVVGVLWMLATGLNFVLVTAFVKLAGSRIPAAESAFLRYLLGLVFLIPVLKPLLAAGSTGPRWRCSRCAGSFTRSG